MITCKTYRNGNVCKKNEKNANDTVQQFKFVAASLSWTTTLLDDI